MSKKTNRPRGSIYDAQLHPATYRPPGNWLAAEPRPRGVRLTGIRYERKVCQEFLRRYDHYLPFPWISWMDSRGWRQHCQPDGLLIDPFMHSCIIVEIKLRHIATVVAELFHLYKPVVEALFPQMRIDCVEVTQWFDPFVICSRQPVLCEFPDRPHPEAFNVHICRPGASAPGGDIEWPRKLQSPARANQASTS
jgi:hypothetical protein